LNFGIIEKTFIPKNKYICYDWPLKTKILFYFWNHPKKYFSPMDLKLKFGLSYEPYTYLKKLGENGLIDLKSNRNAKYQISHIGIIFSNQLIKKGFTEVERSVLYEDDFMFYQMMNYQIK